MNAARVRIGAAVALAAGVLLAGCGSTPSAYQRCTAKVAVFLASPVGQLDADLLGGPAAFKSYLFGECQAKYGD